MVLKKSICCTVALPELVACGLPSNVGKTLTNVLIQPASKDPNLPFSKFLQLT